MKFLFYLCLLISFFINSLYAQHKELEFRHISPNIGLSQSTVQAIVRDQKGFMWFGTRDGLNKYDGYNFTIYKHDYEKKGSIRDNYINDLLEDDEKNLWVGSTAGLDLFDRNLNIFEHYTQDDNAILVKDIFQDTKGKIWVGGREGLFIANKKNKHLAKWKNNKKDHNGLTNSYVNKILEDYNGEMWIGTTKGLFRIDPGKNFLKKYTYDSSDSRSINCNLIRNIHKDINNTLWIGTEGGGLLQYDREHDSFVRFKDLPAFQNIANSEVILCFGETPDNQELWIGSENGGLIIYNYKSKQFTAHKNNSNNEASLSNNSIRSIYKDNIGNMWLGTYSAGVELLPIIGNKFIHYKSSACSTNGLNNNIIKCILEDRDGNLWMGTDGGGINFFDKKNNTYKYYKNDPKNKNTPSSNYIHCMIEFNEDTLVFGYHRGGFDLFNRKTGKFTHFLPDSKNPNSISDITVSSLHKDKDGNLWIGTWGGGLNYYNMKTRIFKAFKNNRNDPKSLIGDIVYSVKEDLTGNIWLATEQGVDLVDRVNNNFIHYLCDVAKKNEKVTNNFVISLHIDKKNNLWAGTIGGGLNLLNKKSGTFTTFTEKNGLPNNIIEAILEDSKGNLWISTNKGISKFNPETTTFRNYGIEDGLQGNEFKRNSSFKNTKGDMYFGGTNGFNVFNPEKIKDNPFVPPVVFISFQIHNKQMEVGDKDSPLKNHISETKEITLSYDQSVFTLKFSALSFTNPEKNQYAYKLDGFEKNWNYVGTERKTTYTNLDPGQYTFKVKASNNDEVWNEEGVSLRLIITPPFWKTWWFKSMILAIILGTAFIWYQARINTIKKQKEVLETQVKERTEELGRANNELSIQAKSLQEANIEIKDSIRAAQSIQKSILPSISSIRKHLPESFVLYKPKDVVSGDFYWYDVKDGKIVIAVVDCTGHGVSGAFMAINGHHLLNQAIYPYQDLVASEVLDRLNEGIVRELHQQDENSEVNDGMDIALCILDKNKKTMQYAGANNPLYILRNNDIIQIRANKYAIGINVNNEIHKFTNNDLDVQEGDIIYIFSDGYADQLGGASGNEKFMYPRFRELLLNIQNENMENQSIALDKSLTKWRGKHEQVDDILVIGFRI